MAETSDPVKAEQAARRRFLSLTSTIAMGGGLAASYGTLGVIAGRFLYPAEGGSSEWQFVARADQLQAGHAELYTAPSGISVVVARQGDGRRADDFIALSSVCPHLGCQVHWEPLHNRFFCPCHNGAFDAQGRATEGPPAKAGQELIRFPLKVENGLLFVQVPIRSVGSDASAMARRSLKKHEGATV